MSLIRIDDNVDANRPPTAVSQGGFPHLLQQEFGSTDLGIFTGDFDDNLLDESVFNTRDRRNLGP